MFLVCACVCVCPVYHKQSLSKSLETDVHTVLVSSSPCILDICEPSGTGVCKKEVMALKSVLCEWLWVSEVSEESSTFSLSTLRASRDLLGGPQGRPQLKKDKRRQMRWVGVRC